MAKGEVACHDQLSRFCIIVFKSCKQKKCSRWIQNASASEKGFQLKKHYSFS